MKLKTAFQQKQRKCHLVFSLLFPHSFDFYQDIARFDAPAPASESRAGTIVF